MRAFYNVCRHRGTRLCAERRASSPARFGVRITRGPTTTTAGSSALRTWTDRRDSTRRVSAARGCARGVWDGFVFVSLAPDGPSLADHLGGLPEKFRSWRMGISPRARRSSTTSRANWKLIVQNYNECLHCPTLHPALNRLSHYLSGENEPLARPTWADAWISTRASRRCRWTGRAARDPLPGLSAEERRHVYYYSVFPNFMIAPHPDYVLTHTLWPLAPNHTRIVCEWLVHPAELAKPGFDLTDATSFWDMTNRQDWHVCELAQAGISSRGYRPGPYSNREDLLYAFDRFVVDALGD